MSSPELPARARPPSPSPSFPRAHETGDEAFLYSEVVRDLPEFVPRYRLLVAAADDDPGEPTVLMELAGFVADRLAAVETDLSMLSRALGLVEALLTARSGDVVGVGVVGYAFFDSFTLEDRRRLAGRLGPRSLGVLESLEQPDDDTEW